MAGAEGEHADHLTTTTALPIVSVFVSRQISTDDYQRVIHRPSRWNKDLNGPYLISLNSNFANIPLAEKLLSILADRR